MDARQSLAGSFLPDDFTLKDLESMKSRLLLTLVALLACNLSALAEEVVVYSARNEQLIKPLYDAYPNETGVQV